ncbi:hypothetical protein Tco_1511292, partial [Tanacetum coccineum]
IPLFSVSSRVLLALGSFRGIFIETMLHRVLISAGKEVDIGLRDGCDKPLRSSPLTHTGMDDFVLSRGVIDAAERKCVKCEAKCAEIGYEKGAIVLLKRIRKFSVTQDIGA